MVIDPRQTLESFAVGPANAAAYAAATACVDGLVEATRPPLLVVGDEGLGKSHLASAVVQAARQRAPDLRIEYLGGAELYHEITDRALYDPALLRASLRTADLVVIDDLHAFAHDLGATIALARLVRDVRPRARPLLLTGRATPALEPLAHRLSPGAPPAVVALHPLDAATRGAILAARAADVGLPLRAVVLRFVAEHLDGAVPDLERALGMLGDHTRRARRRLTLGFARDLLGTWLRPRAPRAARDDAPPGDVAAGVDELGEFIREVGGGRIGVPDVRRNLVTVRLVARDGEAYYLRMEVTVYLEQPLGCRFADAHGRDVPEAWPFPALDGPFRSPEFICTPPTAEFYRAHRNRRYRPGEGTFAHTVGTIFAALHAPEYEGRWR